MNVPIGYYPLADDTVIKCDDIFYSVVSGKLMRADEMGRPSTGEIFNSGTGRAQYFRRKLSPVGNSYADLSL